MVWSFANGERALSKREQEYCAKMNFKAEQALNLINQDVKHMGIKPVTAIRLSIMDVILWLPRWSLKILQQTGFE